MSRQRRYLNADYRKTRNEKPVYQASESEIQSDLKRLKYVKKVESFPVEVVTRIELPKKRKIQVEDDKFVIDGLIKLMSVKPHESKKKVDEPVEKNNEVSVKSGFINPALVSAYAYHAQLIKNFLYMTQLNFIQQQSPYATITSTSDKHIKTAKFILSCKSVEKMKPKNK